MIERAPTNSAATGRTSSAEGARPGELPAPHMPAAVPPPLRPMPVPTSSSGKPIAVHSPHVAAGDSPAAEAAEQPAGEGESIWSGWWLNLPSWLTSTAVHLMLVLVLALVSSVPVMHYVSTSPLISTEPGDGGDAEDLSSSPPPGTPELAPSNLPPVDALPDLAPQVELASAIGPINPELPKVEGGLKLGAPAHRTSAKAWGWAAAATGVHSGCDSAPAAGPRV